MDGDGGGCLGIAGAASSCVCCCVGLGGLLKLLLSQNGRFGSNASHNVVFNHQQAAQQQTSYAPSPAYGQQSAGPPAYGQQSGGLPYGQQSGGPPYGQGLPQSAYVWPQGSMPPSMGQPPQVRGVLLCGGDSACGCCRRYDRDVRGRLPRLNGCLPLG
jgi:hypothetical protein